MSRFNLSIDNYEEAPTCGCSIPEPIDNLLWAGIAEHMCSCGGTITVKELQERLTFVVDSHARSGSLASIAPRVICVNKMGEPIGRVSLLNLVTGEARVADEDGSTTLVKVHQLRVTYQ